MTGLQSVLLAGIGAGLGLWLMTTQLMPAHPNLTQALSLLGSQPRPSAAARPRDWRERLGLWAVPRLPARAWLVSRADLKLAGVSEAGFVGRKLSFALVGLAVPPVVGWLVLLARLHLPVAIPALASLIGAGVGFFLPDLQLRARVLELRREFARALAAYIDLVALERSSGAGTKAALEQAAEVGDSWVFRRLRERLHQTNWAGQPAWDGLAEMAAELNLPELADLADIVRLTGDQGAGVYTILRARAQSMRTAAMTNELTAANEANEKMSVPVSVLGIVFLVIFIGPALMGMLGG